MPREDHKAGYPHLSDAALVVLVGGGDADAFAALYDRHSRSVYWLAHKLTGEKQAAEDLAQDAFLKVGARRTGTGQSVAALGPGSSRWSATRAKTSCAPAPAAAGRRRRSRNRRPGMSQARLPRWLLGSRDDASLRRWVPPPTSPCRAPLVALRSSACGSSDPCAPRR